MIIINLRFIYLLTYFADVDTEVLGADSETTVECGYTPTRRPLAVKNRLHRTHVGIDVDRLPDHVTGNSSRKRRPTSVGSEYEEIMRRCEQWLVDVRRRTGNGSLDVSHDPLNT